MQIYFYDHLSPQVAMQSEETSGMLQSNNLNCLLLSVFYSLSTVLLPAHPAALSFFIKNQ